MTPLVGHAAQVAAFDRALAGGQVHHAWLLAGPEGVGKATFARNAARRLLASDADDAQLRLLDAGTHPDFRELRRLPKDAEKAPEELARSITIEQVRSLGPMLATRPSLGGRRVIVIDTVDELERPGASNALLKNLEEPPAGTIFLLVSHSPGRLLPTIRSRCRLLRFGRLEATDVGAVIRGALPDAAPEEVAALVGASDGAPGVGLRFAGSDIAAIDRALEAIVATGDPRNAERAKLGRALTGKAAQPRYQAFLERAPRLAASRARERDGAALATALDAQAAARRLAESAIPLSLDPAATVWEMAGILSRLAAA